MSVGMRSPQNVAELDDPIGIARLGIKQVLHEGQMVPKVVAGDELVSCEKPDAGAAVQLASRFPGDELLALAVGARWRDRQDRGDLPRVEIVASKPERHERLAVGLQVSLRRGGCQAVRPAHPSPNHQYI